eukprot:scaffold70275_cov63-Phaeocystis_antarctica.AAC.2
MCEVAVLLRKRDDPSPEALHLPAHPRIVHEHEPAIARLVQRLHEPQLEGIGLRVVRGVEEHEGAVGARAEEGLVLHQVASIEAHARPVVLAYPGGRVRGCRAAHPALDLGDLSRRVVEVERGHVCAGTARDPGTRAVAKVSADVANVQLRTTARSSHRLCQVSEQLVVVMTRGLPVCGCTIVARFQLPSASRVTHTADPTFLQPDWGFERAWIAACFADERHG